MAADETELVGRWESIDGKMVADSVCKQIDSLVKTHLVGVAKDKTGWVVLYRDPSDGRYWELSYPQSEMHGGGPPSLRTMDEATARRDYDLLA